MPSTRKKAKKQKTPRIRKKPKTVKLQKIPKAKYNTRPKTEATVVKAHSRTVGGRMFAVREHVRIVAGDRIKSFKITTKEDADNQELFNWKGFEKIEHLNPEVVEMAPADFLFLTAEYHDPEFEMSFPEKFDEKNKLRIEKIDKYAKLFEKLKKTPFVLLVVDRDGKVWKHSPDSRFRVQALKEMGYDSVPVVIVEEN